LYELYGIERSGGGAPFDERTVRKHIAEHIQDREERGYLFTE
jgi:hypothetical protein